MVDELRDALEAASTRGNPVGGEEVLRRAEAAVAPRGRRTVRAAIWATTAAAVLVTATVGGGLLYGKTKLDDIDRIDLAPQLLGSAEPSEPMNVLLVGADGRGGLSLEDQQLLGSPSEVGSARADTIMVLHIDPEAGTALVLSLPRDLWLPIDGGASQRINTALAAGPGALVRTVQDALGIELDHYVQLDFDGFRRMVDALGGVSMRFATPVRDRVTGLAVPVAGCRELDGAEALALVRSRHLQRFDGERWESDPTGDLGRISRQQHFLLSVLTEAANARNPLTVARLLDAAADHVSIDAGLSTDELLRLGRKVQDLPAADVRLLDLPVRDARVGSAAVLEALPSDLRAAGAMLGQPVPAASTGGGASTAVTPEAPCDK